MTALAFWIILSSGWRRRGVAFLAGAIGALAMPSNFLPSGFLPALLAPMMTAVWLLDGIALPAVPGHSRIRTALRTALAAGEAGWWLGFGFFIAGLWWLGAAFLVDAEEFAWALPFGVVGLPAVAAIYTGVGFALASLVWSPTAARVLALAAGLSLTEWLRGHLFTGFPWNEWGQAVAGPLWLAQTGAWIGLYGLNVLAVAIFAAPAVLIDRAAGRGRFAAAAPGVGAALLLAALAAFGAWRVSGPPVATVPGVALRIMQPNLPQDADFRPVNGPAILARYLELSDRATSPGRSGLADVTHLIWPESAFPFVLAREADARKLIGDALPAKTVLITGAARTDVLPGETRTLYYNSVQVVGHDGTILASVDKTHLVPFGEYLPWEGLLRDLGVRNMVAIPGGFTPGPGLALLSVPGLPPVSPLVCYEAIFSGEVIPRNGPRPGLLLNVTNDAWFGLTPGPYQHFAQVRLRAIEEGLPLVRAANTGISAIVDPYGRVLNSLPLGQAGVLDGDLPRALAPPPFARWEPWPFWVLFAVSLSLAFLACRRVDARVSGRNPR